MKCSDSFLVGRVILNAPWRLKGVVMGLVWLALASASAAAGGEAWYIPGWLRSAKPEGGAWKSFKEAVGAEQIRFWTWDGDRIWSKSAANADATAQALADELAALPPERRANLTLVGHSLGARMLGRALARLGARGLKVRQGVLLAPAVRNDDPELRGLGAGSELPVIIVVNPQDVVLKYVYAVAGGEHGHALGADGPATPIANVQIYSVPADITKTTIIDDSWGRTEVIKRIANHHAAFYFAELGRILRGAPSAKPQMRVLQDKVNVEAKVIDAGVWWTVLEETQGWKLEQHVITGHCRILNPEKRRTAWGSEKEMRKSFANVRAQLQKRTP